MRERLDCRGLVLPVAAACISSISNLAQHRAQLTRTSIRARWAMLATNSLETPVIGLVARRDGERIDARTACAQRCASLRCRDPRRRSASPTTSRCSAASSRAPRSLAVCGRRAAQHRRPPGGHYLAPRITYAPDFDTARSTVRTAREVENDSPELLVGTPDAGWNARLLAYWQARDRYLESGRDVQPTYDVREMLAQVRDPLLAVLRISPDFRPAYDPLLQMAGALASSDTAGARDLLMQLVAEQPARPEAAEALRELRN